ncbi:coiled-coil domain-containing protein 93-like isoform X1 [Teleopsis dalmanni]|uniref:coiled-coil domain-containing protein 93-like isoform X1 n=1 Tax=Teleopsis dalmanni TaxID=139649 RepID=UPI0018CE70E3|nr:coiled-coil domain-containing protein 93-like isoform X1 [Teleopsis dalmanni]
MANRDIFSKHLPNVKLATRYDAEGREVQVERREDLDAAAKEEETFEMLVAAGYYRAKIKGLSAFDKIVGGMTWCIECCDYDVDVDLLFHENLTIGQKIALVEKIVTVLPDMKCPFLIEPHQIQGLEFLSIYPVIHWLVKKSVENRTERSQRLKKFAIGQFHNDYQYKTDRENLAKIYIASAHIKRIQELYNPSRQYQRREVTSEDEKTRVRMTLLEYGYRSFPGNGTNLLSTKNTDPNADSNAITDNEIDINQLLKNLYVSKENFAGPTKALDTVERKALHKHYADFKEEMETDAKQLSEQGQFKILEATKTALERKLIRNQKENEELLTEVLKQEEQLKIEEKQRSTLNAQMADYKKIEAQTEPAVLLKVQDLLKMHDDLKKEESDFKDFCRNDLAELQKQIDELEAFNAQNPEEQALAVSKEKMYIKELKLQLAKKNRGIVAIQRQLDSIPDRTELTQYQRRFHELYNEMSAKHLETKQYYTLFNTLNDKKRYMEKELSLLNSICEAYNEGMMTAHGREDFIKQFDTIVIGVKHTEEKVRQKYNEERLKRDTLNEELQGLLELQRLYATAVKQLTKECQRCEYLQQHLNSIKEEKL